MADMSGRRRTNCYSLRWSSDPLRPWLPAVAFWDINSCKPTFEHGMWSVWKRLTMMLEHLRIGIAGKLTLVADGHMSQLGEESGDSVVDAQHTDMLELDCLSNSNGLSNGIIRWFFNNNPGPATVILITREEKHCAMANFMRQNNHTVILCCVQESTPLVLRWAADFSVEWTDLLRGDGTVELIDFRRPKPKLFRPNLRFDDRPIYVWWDYQTCTLPLSMYQSAEQRSKLSQTLQDIFRKSNWWGRIEIRVYANFHSHAVDEDMRIAFRNNNMHMIQVLADVPQYTMILDILTSLDQRPRQSRYLLISNWDFLYMVNRVKNYVNDVIVAKSNHHDTADYERGIRIWDWPTLLYGIHPPRPR